MRKRWLVLSLSLVLTTSLYVFATNVVEPFHPKSLGLSTHPFRFGSSGSGNIGWLMPGNTLVSTSQIANGSLSGFVEATLNVFPYQIEKGTTISLSLYLNGALVTTTSYDLFGNHATPATVTRMIQPGVANFSNSLLGLTVSQFPLNAVIPPGTSVTVTSWVNHPVWVQIDTISPAHSYETVGVSLYSPAPTVTMGDTLAPYTLSVGVESDGQ